MRPQLTAVDPSISAAYCSEPRFSGPGSHLRTHQAVICGMCRVAQRVSQHEWDQSLRPTNTGAVRVAQPSDQCPLLDLNSVGDSSNRQHQRQERGESVISGQDARYGVGLAFALALCLRRRRPVASELDVPVIDARDHEPRAGISEDGADLGSHEPAECWLRGEGSPSGPSSI